MNQLKRFLGILWMMIGPIVFILLFISALQNINSTVKGDISNPIPWIIILAIFAPIAIGLTVFGWYSWKGEYDDR
jgi:uncharacterized membrane protein YadS